MRINRSGQSQPTQIRYLQNQQVETIVQGKFSGEGIKKTPAYETPLSKHALDNWRKEFWETRTSGSRQIWNCIRSACEEDHETAAALVMAAGLDMPNNSLTLLIDETGIYYRVPICLINDPISYDRDYNAQKLANKARPDTITIELKVRNTTHGDMPMKAENTTQVEEFKRLYINKLKEDKTEIPDMEAS